MDPIADMFSQLKNAENARKKGLVIGYSKMKMAILAILKERHYISDYNEIELKSENDSKFKKIEITLKKETRTDISRVSRPGRRVYAISSRIPRRKSPTGLVIVSTSEGVMEGENARKKGLGGEVVAEII